MDLAAIPLALSDHQAYLLEHAEIMLARFNQFYVTPQRV
jgi:hypothetical protein